MRKEENPYLEDFVNQGKEQGETPEPLFAPTTSVLPEETVPPKPTEIKPTLYFSRRTSVRTPYRRTKIR